MALMKHETITEFKKLYDSSTFRKQGYEIVDMLAEYLQQTKEKTIPKVLPNTTPDEMLKIWDNNFTPGPCEDHKTILKRAIYLSNNLHHPQYIGHQVTGPLPLAVLCDLVSNFLNNTSAAYEMGPVSTIMEKQVISWMAGLIGFGEEAEGIFTSGGTVGNLTCLLAARQNMAGYDVWNEGTQNAGDLVFMISELAHYSSKRAIHLMGFGEENVVQVPADKDYMMDMKALEEFYNKASKSGKRVVAVVANACCTPTGTYDPLDKIADFCEKYNLWFHVDGAHGASAAISEKYRYLLKGAERADSIIWDPHKMMLMPALLTAVIFRKGGHSYEVFSQKASYIFEKSAREEWYNLCHRTMECTKSMMILKLYTCLKALGTKVFADYLDYTHDLAKTFAKMLINSGNFEIACEPHSNIVCFRYTGKKSTDANKLQKELRHRLLESESFYITQTDIYGKTYMRCTVINPHTTEVELKALIEKLRELA